MLVGGARIAVGSPDFPTGEVDVPEAFEVCTSCHAFTPDEEPLEGPSLWQVAGRPIASLDSYASQTARSTATPGSCWPVRHSTASGRPRLMMEASENAGVVQTGRVNPHAIALLKRLNYPTVGLRSKSWDEFAASGAPAPDFIFTVCDNAAGEVCPIWPGQPMTAHWGIPDPAAAEGTEAEVAAAFADAYRMLEQRIGIFTSLPLASLDRLALQKRLDAIGGNEGASSSAAE